MIAFIISFLLIADLIIVPLANWPAMVVGFFGFDAAKGGFNFIPQGADMMLLAGFAAYSGAGGCINATITNWMRDKGFGMGSVVGYIPSLVGGQTVKLSHTGSVFPITPDNMRKWKLWWKYAGADQYGLWMLGAFIGMGLPSLLYAGFIARGTNISSATIAATLGNTMYSTYGMLLWVLTLFCGLWILFSTQLGIVDGFVRGCTDMIWTGSGYVRAKIQDVRVVYYSLLGLITAWGIGCIAYTVVSDVTGFFLILLGASWAGVNFIFLAGLVLIVNRKFLPKELKPALWREVVVIALLLFFAFFSYNWLFTNASGLAIMPIAMGFFAIFLVWGLASYFMKKK